MPEAFTQESISLGRLTGKSTLLQVDGIDWLTGNLFCLSVENWGEIEYYLAANWVEEILFQNDSPSPKIRTCPHKLTTFHIKKVSSCHSYGWCERKWRRVMSNLNGHLDNVFQFFQTDAKIWNSHSRLLTETPILSGFFFFFGKNHIEVWDLFQNASPSAPNKDVLKITCTAHEPWCSGKLCFDGRVRHVDLYCN